MTNHLVDLEQAEAECIRYAHSLFLELNRPETFWKRLRSAPVNDARYRKKMCRRKNLGGMWGQFGFGGAYDFMFMLSFSPAAALAYIRPQAEERLPRRWTPAAKRKLCELLKYNEHDVRGMRHLTLEMMGLADPEVSVN